MHALRRHGALRCFPLVHIGVIGVVAHDAEFRIIPLLAMWLKLPMARVAILDLDRLSPGHRLTVGNRKVSDDVQASVPLSFFDHSSVGPFDTKHPVTLNPDGPR